MLAWMDPGEVFLAEFARMVLQLLKSDRDVATERLGVMPQGHGVGRVASMLDALAGDLIQTGSADAAQRIFEAILVHLPRASDAWAGLGAAREAAGDVEGAVQALEKAVELAPQNQPAAAALERLRKR